MTRVCRSVYCVGDDGRMHDRLIGRAVAVARGDLAQDALAARMRERGWAKWSQSTVWSVEKGARPLRLAEARDLAEVLDIHVVHLLRVPDSMQVEKELREAMADVREGYNRVAYAVENLLAAQDSLDATARKAKKTHQADLAQLIAQAEELRRKKTPHHAVLRGRGAYEEQRQGSDQAAELLGGYGGDADAMIEAQLGMGEDDGQ